MTEGVQAPEDAAAARATEQARRRKERREAKLRAGGADRLSKITGLGGGIPKDTQPRPTAQSTPTPPRAIAPSSTIVAEDQHGDPEEVDISQHYYEPRTSARPSPGNNTPDISEAQLRQLMLGASPAGTPQSQGRDPFGDRASPMPGVEGMEEDPMFKMLQQMMGGGMPGGAGAGAGAGPGTNPFAGTPMESLFGNLAGGLGGMPTQTQQAAAVTKNQSANLWRIIHAVFALGLGLYVALSTTFTGTKAERETGAIRSTNLLGERDVEQARAYFFYIFTSVEALLLTTRYFLDNKASRGSTPPMGWAWTATGFLPGSAKVYARHALRYGRILGSIRNDALVCVFVMGLCALLRS